MGRLQRFGIRINRSWMILLLILGVIAAAAYWMGPLRPPPPALALVVLHDGEAVDDVAVRGERDAAGNLRFALPLAVQNVGYQEARPRQVTFSVPGRYRLVGARGPLDSEVTAGVPLRRYVLPVAGSRLRPGDPPRVLGGLETVWLEPDLPEWYCLDNGGVPEFMPAPALDPQALSEVRIFYSLGLQRPGQRSTGVLTVRVDPTQLEARSAPMPPSFPTQMDNVDAEAPELGTLSWAGERRAFCGDPEQPMELFTVTWESAGGARFYVVYVQDAPRKHLYDLNGDGTIDLEMWDADGDGNFDARREARYAVPDFLRPRERPGMQLLQPDTVPPDSAFLALFDNRLAGPFRFTRRPERRAAAAGPPGTVEPGTPGAEGAAADTLQPAVAGPAGDMPGPLPPPADSAWLELFRDVRAGPFRFTRGREPAGGVPGMPVPLPDTMPAVQPDTQPEPPPVRRAPRRVPLGTPVGPPGG